MTGSRKIKIAVISDLHAYSDRKHENDSHLDISCPKTPAANHPIEGLKSLIGDKDARITSDILVCAGDIANKSDPAGINYAWQEVNEIRRMLEADYLYITTGNHDLDSRYIENSYDPKGHLQSLVPEYPFTDKALRNQYWAQNFAIHDSDEHRVLVLNSSAFHGGGEKEIQHGRISPLTLNWIDAELQQLPIKALNILVTHHHPQRVENLNLEDYEIMDGGGSLLELLGTGKYGRWLVIHGHKHLPKISYAMGSASAPIVFSAGSLSASLYKELSTQVRNQFYVIEVHLDKCEELGLVGEIAAWDWSYGYGWKEAHGSNLALPKRSGFGFRGDPRILARRILKDFDGSNSDWDVFVDLFPEARYLIRQDYESFKSELEQHKLGIVEANGVPVQIGRRP